MESVRVRLFLGTLVGIAAGMLIAEALPLVVWWFAIPIGGLLGASVFAAPEIRRATPIAAQVAWQPLVHIPTYWKQYQEAPVKTKRKVQIYVAVHSTLFLGAGLAIGSALAIQRGEPLSTPMAVMMILGFICYISLAAAPVFFTANSRVPIRAIVYASPPGPFLLIVVVLALFMRFLGKTIWTGTPKALIFLGRALPEVGKFLARFAVELFWQVNSKPLAITAIGSGLGVGLFFPLFRLMLQWEILSSTVIGAMIGALFALAYYELVPKRVLKTR